MARLAKVVTDVRQCRTTSYMTFGALPKVVNDIKQCRVTSIRHLGGPPGGRERRRYDVANDILGPKVLNDVVTTLLDVATSTLTL